MSLNLEEAIKDFYKYYEEKQVISQASPFS